eukprot:scaffold7076_cov149-Amphora_coffeaeformis.AAC.6
MVSLFHRKAVLKLFVGLLVMSIAYVTLAGRFLLINQNNRNDEREVRSTSATEDRGASNDVVTSYDSDVSTDLASTSTINVTEALERILDFFPLDVPNERPGNKRPQQGGNPVKRTALPATGNGTNLAQLIDETTWQVKASVQEELDFAVIAHAKTGTTFIQSTWFAQHAEIHMPSKECRLMPQEGGPAQVVKLMHSLRGGSSGPAIYGYKNPQDINRPRALRHFQEYFPKTKLIVVLSNTFKGLRHPIWWFQSFYRFRNRRGKVLPPAETLVGACLPEWKDVCTDGANYHAHLSNFGLTNRSSTREMKLLSTNILQRRALKPPLPNPIFLYEQSQLDPGHDESVAEALRQDLSAYLGLHTPLPPLLRTYQPPPDANFSICEPRYQALRQELVRVGQAAGAWIREFFLDQPTVHVSSRKEFERLLGLWAHDPCAMATNATSTNITNL